MSRSNPQEHGSTNPAVRLFEWHGGKGVVRYYDKDAKQNFELPLPFTFIWLDQLGTVKGWHNASDSGIYANEVKNTSTDVLTVKAFKGGVIAEGLYAEIKDRVNKAGGHYVANCYIAFKDGDELAIGGLRFKGAALGAWMEFVKANRNAVHEQAVAITGAVKGKKGSITFYTPTFEIKAVSGDTDSQAVTLDKVLQEYLTGYLKHGRKDTASPPDADTYEPPPPDDEIGGPVTDSDIPW